MKTIPDYPMRPALLNPRVKVTPLSCHCKLKSLVPLLRHLLTPPESAEKVKRRPLSHVPQTALSFEFTHP